MLRVMVMVRVSIRVYVMILFCRSIALFSVFYAFNIYISRHIVMCEKLGPNIMCHFWLQHFGFCDWQLVNW